VDDNLKSYTNKFMYRAYSSLYLSTVKRSREWVKIQKGGQEVYTHMNGESEIMFDDDGNILEIDGTHVYPFKL